jgi:hypothetical protein
MIAENILINLGFQYEKALTDLQIRSIGYDIRCLLETLDPQEQTEARVLLEIGRSEARK